MQIVGLSWSIRWGIGITVDECVVKNFCWSFPTVWLITSWSDVRHNGVYSVATTRDAVYSGCWAASLWQLILVALFTWTHITGIERRIPNILINSTIKVMDIFNLKKMNHTKLSKEEQPWKLETGQFTWVVSPSSDADLTRYLFFLWLSACPSRD